MTPLLKTCGLRDPENIKALARLEPDCMGFIFYPASKRNADPGLLAAVLAELSDDIRKVGVFVNEDAEVMIQTGRLLDLDILQLHGEEDPEIGIRLQAEGFEVWKAFGISTHPDWQHMENWVPSCDAFLFDTASAGYGGSGLTFEHSILKNYPFKKPFWLSGGIGPDFRTLPEFFDRLPFLGLDINSRFESEPGLKKVGEVKKFIEYWRNKSIEQKINPQS